MKSHFLLAEDITFFNFGSFGACPRSVFENYQYWQRELEKEPVQFITKTGIEALKNSKKALASFINCDENDFFFTANPTTAINTLVKSLALTKGDEILSTNLEYGAMDRTWNYYCEQKGAKYIQQPISLPIKSKAQFLEEFWSGLTPQTKVIFISQITSATALILPVKEIIEKAKALNLITIIDGAHVPGHIPLDIKALAPDYYTGAVHKWLMAPKGCSFLYVDKKFQDQLDPLIISWGYESDYPSGNQFLDYHEYNGTRDFSAHLTVPAIMKFRDKYEWEELTQLSKDLILEWYPKFCELLNTSPICPLTNEFLGQMCSIPIKTEQPEELKERLYNKYKIEIPITQKGTDYYIRISIQPFNDVSELSYLYKVLEELKNENVLIK